MGVYEAQTVARMGPNVILITSDFEDDRLALVAAVKTLLVMLSFQPYSKIKEEYSKTLEVCREKQALIEKTDVIKDKKMTRMTTDSS